MRKSGETIPKKYYDKQYSISLDGSINNILDINSFTSLTHTAQNRNELYKFISI